MKERTKLEIRRMSVDEFLTDVDVPKLCDKIQCHYAERYEKMYLTSENILSHVRFYASCWVSSLKMKTLNSYVPDKSECTEMYKTFEEFVIEKIASSFDYDLAYYIKLNRLPNASPVKSESEAAEQYNAHKAEINKIADAIQKKIRKDFPNNHSVLYMLQHFDECIIQCIQHYDIDAVAAVKKYLYDEITVPFKF